MAVFRNLHYFAYPETARESWPYCVLPPKARALHSQHYDPKGSLHEAELLSLPQDNLSATRAILPSQDLNEGTKPGGLTFRRPAPVGQSPSSSTPKFFFTMSRKNYVLEKRIHQSAAQRQAEGLRQAIGNTDGTSEVSLLFCCSGTHLRCGVQSTPWTGRTGAFTRLLGGFMMAQEGRVLAS